MIERAVLFTGLVRNEDKFLDFLNLFEKSSLENRPPIYFSTWVGEVAKYPAISEKLKNLGAVILEQKQPDLVLPGHVLHQVAALDFALSIIGRDVFVYKSRPDFVDFGTYKSFMALEPIPVLEKYFEEIAPTNKIHVLGFFAAHPFYINDITYCGVARDLLRITDLPFTAMSRYHRVAPEQLIWGGSAMGRVRIFDRYFRSNTGLIFDDETKVRANIEILKKSACYVYALAAYFMILDAHFAALHLVSDSDVEFLKEISLDDLLWGRVDNPSIVLHPTAYTNSVRRVGLVKNILAGEFKNSPFGERFLEAIDVLQSAERASDYLTDEIENSALAYGDAVKEIGIHGSKAICRRQEKLILEGAGPGWNQQQTGTPLTEKLEGEVNYLRRVNNDLQERLRKASL
jgi:hypothetical protein